MVEALKTVLVTGASGQIGIFLLPRMLAQGYQVLALSRHPKPDWYPEFSGIEWLQPDQLVDDGLASVRYLVSAGPLSLVPGFLPQMPQLKRTVLFSTTSVFTKSDSSNTSERQQIEQIIASEAVLKAQLQKLNVRVVLFRPTLIYGAGIDMNIGRLHRFIRRFGFIPLAGQAKGLRQPVHGDDLAIAAMSALHAEHKEQWLESPLCGGRTLSYRQMTEAVFNSLGKKARIISMPEKLLRLIARLSGINPEMISRQNLDLIFDDSLAKTEFGYQPRAFAPGFRDFQLPTQAYLQTLADAD